jgi:sugar phosphate isomerase/epimerase
MRAAVSSGQPSTISLRACARSTWASSAICAARVESKPRSLGEGDLDIQAMLGELRDSGFSGPVSMEIEFTNYEWPDWRECVEAARRGKAYWDSLTV